LGLSLTNSAGAKTEPQHLLPIMDFPGGLLTNLHVFPVIGDIHKLFSCLLCAKNNLTTNQYTKKGTYAMDFNDIKDFLFFFFANLGSQATGTLIAVAGSLLGVLAGSVISRRTSNETIIRSHKNAIDIMQRQDFNKAAALFRDAFYPDLIFMKHNAIVAEKGSADNLSLFLSAGYLHRHLKAFETFKNYLSAEEGKYRQCMATILQAPR
jgi:hypothetical protein